MNTPNVIGALYTKIQRLNKRKTMLTSEYNAQCAEIDQECSRCGGTGIKKG